MSFLRNKNGGRKGEGLRSLNRSLVMDYGGPFPGDPMGGSFYSPTTPVFTPVGMRGSIGTFGFQDRERERDSVGSVGSLGSVISAGTYNTYINSNQSSKKLTPASKRHSTMESSRKTVPATEVDIAENNMDTPEHQTLYGRGYDMRRQVVGEDYVATSLEKNSSDFTRPLVQFATESAWGTIWTRPGLELKTRSLLNLVMLTALGKWIELGTHVRGAIRNGATEVEIREALLQASAYCGLPAGMEAFRVADRVLNEMEEKGELIRGGKI